MNKKFTKLITAAMLLLLITPPMWVWGQAPVNTVLWGETWARFSANDVPSGTQSGNGLTAYQDVSISYAVTNGGGTTKIYNESIGGGTAPELLLAKSNATWTITGIPTGQATEMSLSFKSNKTTFSVTSTTEGITISGSGKSWAISSNNTVSTFNLTITNTGSSNSRIDDFVLAVTTAGSSGGNLEDSNLTITNQSTDLVFDLYNNAAAQAINYTTSSTGDITITPTASEYFSYVHDAGTITVTPTAVTPNPQTVTINQAADETYNAGSATFTVSVSNSAPQYTVTYKANGGTGDDIPVQYYEGDDVTVAANTFSYAGHAFTKWNTVAGGTGTDYLPDAVINNISANIDLYAQWEESNETTYDFTQIEGFSDWTNSYSEHVVTYSDATVTFASACHQTNTITNQPVTKGQPVSLVMTDGSTLNGVTFNCTQWGSKEQTITLHYSTDSGENYTSTGITSTNFTISSNSLPTGTNAVKITFSSTSNQVGIASATITKGAVLYTVTYDANGATSGDVPTDAIAYSAGATVTVLGNTGNLAKAGYTFGGWNTHADGTGSNYSADDNFTISANTTLYAKWNAKTITGLSHTGTPTQTTYSAGESFDPSGLTVTATFDDESNENVTALVTWTPDPLTAGTTSVTGTYMGQTINVNDLTVTAAPGSQENPYTVAQALAASAASTGVYVRGIVSSVYSTSLTNNGQIRYYISDDGTTSNEMNIYNGLGINGAAFTSVNDIQVGDEVVVTGDISYYSNANQLNASNQLVSLKLVKPTFSVAAGEVTSGTIVTITDLHTDATIYYTTDGTEPTTESSEYNNQISITTATTLKAIAVKSGYTTSDVSSAEYTIIVIPVITVTANDPVSVTAASGSGELALSYDNLTISQASDFAVQFYNENDEELNSQNEPDWIIVAVEAANPSGYKVSYTVEANTVTSARSAYFKVFAMGNQDYVYSNKVTITQAAYVNPANKYIRFSGELVEGDYLIVYDGVAMNNTVSSDRLQYEEVASTNDVIITNDATIVWHIAKSGDYWTIKNTSSNTFAASTGAKNKAQMLEDGTDDKALWTISGTDTYDFVNKQNTTNSVNANLRRNGSYGFACYADGTGGALSLYMKNCVLPVTNDALTQTTEIPEGNITMYDNLTIPANEDFVLTVSGTLEVTGTFTNTVAAHLIIKDGGQLRVYASGAKDGVQATVEKDITAATNWGEQNPENPYTPDGWYFIAAPLDVSGYSPENVTNLLTGNYDFYKLNPANSKWENYKNQEHTNSFSFQNGISYLYANASDQTLAFAGAIKPYSEENSANQVTVSEGWNLIGNPFSFNTYVNQSYYKLNDDRTAIEAVVDNAEIAPCTGIIVKATSAANVTFSETASRGLNGNVGIMLTKVGTRSNATLDNAILSFNEGSQLEKFYFMQQNANLYIPQGTEEYAIVNAQAQGEMPVNFRANENGQYTLTVNAENVKMNYLHLIDNMTGADIDLLATPSYTFNAKTTDYESRFRLVFAANNSSEESNSENASFAFFANGNLIINNEGEATLQIFDMLGHQLECRQVHSAFSIPDSAFAPGVYVLRLVNGNNVKTPKVVVK